MSKPASPTQYQPGDTIVNGFITKNFILESDSKLALMLREKLVDEYKVTTISENMVLDMVVTAYIRYLECSRLYTGLLESEKQYTYNEETEEEDETGWVYHYTESKTAQLEAMGRQMNIAYQQYLSGLTFLREFKRPPIKVNIKTKQAFVAQNQQFNKNA